MQRFWDRSCLARLKTGDEAVSVCRGGHWEEMRSVRQPEARPCWAYRPRKHWVFTVGKWEPVQSFEQRGDMLWAPFKNAAYGIQTP